MGPLGYGGASFFDLFALSFVCLPSFFKRPFRFCDCLLLPFPPSLARSLFPKTLPFAPLPLFLERECRFFGSFVINVVRPGF
jgi:hypothetical protein